MIQNKKNKEIKIVKIFKKEKNVNNVNRMISENENEDDRDNIYKPWLRENYIYNKLNLLENEPILDYVCKY